MEKLSGEGSPPLPLKKMLDPPPQILSIGSKYWRLLTESVSLDKNTNENTISLKKKNAIHRYCVFGKKHHRFCQTPIYILETIDRGCFFGWKYYWHIMFLWIRILLTDTVSLDKNDINRENIKYSWLAYKDFAMYNILA